jgi:hypothetical protein
MQLIKSKLGKSLSIIILAFLVSISILVPISVYVLLTPRFQADLGSIRGWAIIVNGGYESNFFNSSMVAYEALLSSGYNDSTIYFLDAINRTQRMDALATKENAENAIARWLGNRSDANDLCVIFFEDHGEPGIFELNPQEQIFIPIYYYELNEWLANVNYGRLILVVDASYSGGCINNLSGKDRIIISSVTPDGVTGESIFSGYFWPKTVNNNIMDAFNDAAWNTWNCTKDLPNPLGDPNVDWPQNPQLDDNGDKIGNWGPDNPLPTGGDGYLARATYLKPAMMANLTVSALPSTNALARINENISRNSLVCIIIAKDSDAVRVTNRFKTKIEKLCESWL